MPVAAPPPSSDPSIDPGGGSAAAALLPQVSPNPGSGQPRDFDQFLPKPKVRATAGNSAPAAPSAQPGTAAGASAFRRSRAAVAATAAGIPAAPAPAPAAAPSPASSVVIDPSHVQPAFFPAVAPPPPTPDGEALSAPTTAGVNAVPASSDDILAAGAPSTLLAASLISVSPGREGQQTAALQAATVQDSPLVAEAASTGPKLPQAMRPPGRNNKGAGAPAPANSSPPESTSEVSAATDSLAAVRIPFSPSPTIDPGAKIAAAPPPVSPTAANPVTSGEKKTLISSVQSDKEALIPVGISGAQSSSAMSAETPDFTAAGRLATLPPAPPQAAAAPAAAPLTASAPTESARAAVEAVVNLVDAQASRSQEPVTAVSLNFKFGADDLAVRVEWRNGEVHTQFRTDSVDLRTALAGQWQAVAPGSAGRSAHFAAPVFSSTTDQASSTAGDGRNARQYAQPDSNGQPGGGRLQRQPARSSSPGTPAPKAAPSLPTALRLHTFA